MCHGNDTYDIISIITITITRTIITIITYINTFKFDEYQVAYPAARVALGIKSKTNAKLPKFVLHQCLEDIFRYFLMLNRVIVIVENISSADHSSMEILINLIGSSCCGLIVMTTEPLEDVRSVLCFENESDNLSKLHDERKMEEHSPDDFIMFSKLCITYERIVRSSCTLLIQMNEYSVLDVDQLLCETLKLEVCPDGIPLNVHQLSGGDPFWSRELAHFIELIGNISDPQFLKFLKSMQNLCIPHAYLSRLMIFCFSLYQSVCLSIF